MASTRDAANKRAREPRVRRARQPRSRRALELRRLEEGQAQTKDEERHPRVQPMSQIMFEGCLVVHALEQAVHGLARDVGAAAPHTELALDRRARPPRPLRRQRADADRRDEDGRAEVARELFGGALAAPDVRGPADPGHERDLHAGQRGVELEGRSSSRGARCRRFRGRSAFLLFRVDGVGAGAVMLLVLPFNLRGRYAAKGFHRAMEALNGCQKCWSTVRNGGKRSKQPILRSVS